MPEVDVTGSKVWPSQKSINERYSEMNPWDKEWFDLDKGPMRYRIRERRARLAKLEQMKPTIGTAADKKGELLENQ